MKLATTVALVTSLAISTTASAKVSSGDPDLPIAFINAIPDICFQTARGDAPTTANASTLLLEPLSGIPPFLRANFGNIPTWFRLQSKPENVFIGVGDRPNACHLVLADTTQTREVQDKVLAVLRAIGFVPIQQAGPSAPITDRIFVKQVPDGYMLVSLQGPTGPVQGGMGYQAVVDVNLMPKAMFESLLKPKG
jgi:hypothetical protein